MSSVYKNRKSPIFGMIMFIIVLSVLLAAIFGVFVIDISTTGTVETETHVTSITTGVLYDIDQYKEIAIKSLTVVDSQPIFSGG